jgi:predicted lipoprotein with Yx(FWY)xxD motif
MSIQPQIFFRIIIFSIILIPLTLIAQWSSDPTVNTPICTADNDQLSPAILSDEKGGAYIVWSDHRNEPTLFGGDIFMQRINSDGEAQWTADGMVIYQWAGGQVQPKIVSDGNGGNIIVWRSITGLFDGKLYAQRTDSTGLTLWSGFGMPVCISGVSNYHDMIATSTGGAFISWSRDGDIYAQRIDDTGSPLWTVNGVAICQAVNNQTYTAMAGDGNDGAFLVWKDERAGFSDPNIYAQHIAANGNISWQTDGIGISTNTGFQQDPQILASDNSTAYIAWHDTRNANGDIFAQRIDTSGTISWSAGGLAICSESHEQNNVAIASDGAGGVIMSWTDQRNDQGNIYAQRINAAGTAQWTANGIPVCTAANIQDWSTIIADGSGGVIIVWQDQRAGGQPDIYAQRLDASGTALWTANGVAICTATGEQVLPVLINDGSGGAIISWEDERQGLVQNNIYAQWVDNQGNLAGVVGIEEDKPAHPSEFRLHQNYPNPFNPTTNISFEISNSADVRLDIYDILGHHVATVVNEKLPAGEYEYSWIPENLASGIYYYQLQTGDFRDVKKMVLLK